MAISDYSTTPASNTAISGIDISGTTGKVKDGDNAIRQLMADIKAGVPYLSGTTIVLPSGATGGISFSIAAAGTIATLTSTDAGAGSGPDIDLVRNSASPAASDTLGVLRFNGKDSGGNTTIYGSVYGVISDPTDGSEDGGVYINVMRAGSAQVFALMGGAAGDALQLSYGQVKFPASQNQSSDPNTLDDYEEGSSTPTPTADSGTFTSVSASLYYTKTGDRVVFSGSVVITTAGTAAGRIKVPLPFTPSAASSVSVSETGQLGGTGVIASGDPTLYIAKYDTTTLIASSRTITFGGNFRTAG